MDKIYNLENFEIKVSLDKGIVRLYSDKNLWNYLNEEVKLRTFKLVETIKADYTEVFGKSLDINNKSFVVEIWAHIFSDYIGLLIKKHINISWIKKLVQKGIKRAEIIDCGEKHLDSNRWLWDFVGRFVNLTLWIFPNNIGKRNLKV
ncbi:hypothetical protein [Pedobacter jejuensis]|uniref:Uncharacterized protein n=1 Tax=Pedobacter jejuensis TaxID=1268550 RepID=A0A3N0BTI2_9SPHI|nr:hypothetical protein [Pedobacter jejuensis]RNL52407.1 hypothetical protein D7004_12670 [Pedobacter jejuensis]